MTLATEYNARRLHLGDLELSADGLDRLASQQRRKVEDIDAALAWAAATIAAQLRQLAELRAAIKPFSDAAGCYRGPDDLVIIKARHGDGRECAVKLGHLRTANRARSARP